MIKKIVLNGGLVVLVYVLCVYFFKTQKIIFSVFMIAAFIVSMYMSYKNVISLFIPLLMIWIIHLFLPDSQLSTVIIYIIFTPLTFLLGYYLKNKSFFLKVIYFLILILVGIYGFVNLWFYLQNVNARKTEDSPKMIFISSNNQIRIDTIQNKVIVLDYWTTNCGVCFKKFPEYEKLYLKYKDNPKVSLYAINIPVKRDTVGYAKAIIKKYNYQFPVLYSASDTIPKQLGFNKYPHLVILKDGEIRFNGSPNLNEKHTFIFNLEDEIERLLNE
jgi:thiol-disulfide isomerase/thioredoxin